MRVKSPFPPIPPLPELNFHSVLFEQPPGNAIPRDHVQYIDALSGKTCTVGQFIELARDAATALAASEHDGGLGVQLTQHTRVPASRHSPNPKEIVAILSPNCIDYIILVHACIALAVPFALVPSGATSYELEYLLNKSTPTRLFVHPSLLKQALAAAEQLKFPSDRIYLLDTDGAPHQSGLLDLTSLIQNVKQKGLPRQPIVQVRKDTLAYLVFSSGTSGRPKAVMVSHGNMQFALVQMLSVIVEAAKLLPASAPAPPPARWLCALPFYHAYGLHFYMTRSFLLPSTYIIFPKWNVDQALDAIPKYKISHLSLVPSMVHQLVYHDKTARTNTSSVLLVACGAAHLPPQLGQKMRKTFTTLTETLEGYGLSECTVASMLRPYPGMFGMQPIADSTGILIAGQEGRVVREDGTDADYNEPGELWLKGGHIVLGYYNDEKATRDTFTPDGWLKTGDLFRVDESGVFYFEDRAKDTLKISGAQVSPAEIEVTLLDHPDKLIMDAAVAGVFPPASTASQRSSVLTDERLPRAWVVLSPAGRNISKEEVKRRLDRWVKERLSKYKQLRGGIEVIDAIPKSPTGKVLRRVLQERYEKGNKVPAKL